MVSLDFGTMEDVPRRSPCSTCLHRARRARRADHRAVVAPDTPWVTVVWNDPVNLMTYVAFVFQEYFGYDRAKAERLMLQVHEEGRSAVSNGSREEMERDVAAHARLWPLGHDAAGQMIGFEPDPGGVHVDLTPWTWVLRLYLDDLDGVLGPAGCDPRRPAAMPWRRPLPIRQSRRPTRCVRGCCLRACSMTLRPLRSFGGSLRPRWPSANDRMPRRCVGCSRRPDGG